MSSERWTPTEERRERPDPRRRHYFQEWCAFGLAHLGITYGVYAEHRAAGTWEQFCEDTWGNYRFDPNALEPTDGSTT